MMLWLHSQGYTYFSIPRLTYPEIGALVEGYNRKMKRQQAEQKKADRKLKMKRGGLRRK